MWQYQEPWHPPFFLFESYLSLLFFEIPQLLAYLKQIREELTLRDKRKSKAKAPIEEAILEKISDILDFRIPHIHLFNAHELFPLKFGSSLF